MNLSDSDNDTLIASCFDFIDINDDTNDSDDNDDYDGIHRDYSYHTTNNIQQYFKSNPTRVGGGSTFGVVGSGAHHSTSNHNNNNKSIHNNGFLSHINHPGSIHSPSINNNNNNNGNGKLHASQDSSVSEISDLDDSDEDIFGLLSNQPLEHSILPPPSSNIGVVGQRRRNNKQPQSEKVDTSYDPLQKPGTLLQPVPLVDEQQPVIHHPTVAELLVANKSKSSSSPRKQKDKQHGGTGGRQGVLKEGKKEKNNKNTKSSQTKKYNNNNNNNKDSNNNDSSFGGVKILKRDSNIDSDQLNKLFSAKEVSGKNLKDATTTASASAASSAATPTTSSQKKERRSKNRKQQRGGDQQSKDTPSSTTKLKQPTTPTNTNTTTSTNGKDVNDNNHEKLLREQEREKRRKDEKTLGRVLGETPIHFDLDTVSFSAANSFNKGEIVLVPRSRGGFTYGKIYDVIQSNQCHHDQSVHHPGVQYRAVYPSGSKKDNMFKDLNSSYLGKLVPIDKVQLDSAKSFILQLQPDGRNIGQKAALKDLQNLVFSPSTRFHSNQIALIPRSKGGFTYGCVLKECKVPCKVGDIKHEVRGYRVIVEKKETITVKDLIVGNIGQIFVSQPVQQQSQQQSGQQHHQKEKLVKQQQQQQQQQSLPKDVDDDQDDEIDEADEENELEHESDSESESEIEEGDEEEEDEDSDEEEIEDSDEEEILWNGESSSTINQSLSMVGSPSVLSSPKIQSTPAASEPISITPPSSQPNTNTTTTTTTSTGLTPVQLPANLPSPGSRGVIEMPQDSVVFVGGKSKKKPSLVVIDGPNVAIKYSNKKNSLSVVAIKKALDYYIHRGYEAVAFIPESVVSRKQSGPNAPMKLSDFQPMIDNHQLLQELAEKGQICITPPQDYDDSYAIQYAKKQNALIITNDRYNDHINNQPSEMEKKKARKFIREHSISFTFVRNEFLPNPDFVFPST